MIKPKLEINVLEQILKAHYKELIKDAKMSYIAVDLSSGGAAVTLESSAGFTIKQVVITGEPGNEESELTLTHASSAVSGKIVTMTANFVYDHPQGTPVYIIPFDQIELYRTTNTTSPTLGSGILATIDIQPSSDLTIYRDTANSTGYGWFRFKDSVNTLYSPLSDATPYTGFADNSVFSIKRRARMSGGWEKNAIITDDVLNKWLWEGRRELFNKLKRWSFNKVIDNDLGSLTEGDYRIAVPTDLSDPNTDKNVERVSIGSYQNMTQVSKKVIDTAFIGISQTTIAATVAAGAITAELTDVGDLDDSGTIQLGDIEITYTGRTVATNTLTGIPAAGEDGAVTAEQVAGLNVYQGASLGLPSSYCIQDGYIYFNRVVHDDYADMNVWIDYFKTLTAYDSDGDVLDEPDYDMFVNYLSYRIKKRLIKGFNQLTDDDYQQWLLRSNDLIVRETNNQGIQMFPDIDHLNE